MQHKNSIILRGEIRGTQHSQFSVGPKKETPGARQETSPKLDARDYFGAGGVSRARGGSSGKQSQIKTRRPLKVQRTPAED